MPRLSRDGSDIVLFDLKAAREARNLTQIVAADILCTSQASVARWEKSGAMPKMARRLWEYHWLVNPEIVASGITTKPHPGAAVTNGKKAKRIDIKKTKLAEHEDKKAKHQLPWQKNLRKRRRSLKLVVSNEPEPDRDEAAEAQEEV